MSNYLPLKIRFWRFVTSKGKRDCWEWQGYRERQGYGTVTDDCGKRIKAHRASWLIHNGAISKGKIVCHKCDNPPCVNPFHLFLGTHQDNMTDWKIKGLSLKGERNGRSVLTEQEVRHIVFLRKTKNFTMRKLGQLFNVSYATVNSIVLGKLWKHLHLKKGV